MHGVVRGVGDPRLLVDHRQPPAAMACACEMIEPRHRTIVDVEGEALLGLTAERKPDRRLDRSAMRDDDHVLARLLGVDALDRAADAVIEIHETLAAGRGFVDRRKPVAADRPAREERRAIHALPFAEMLFGERVHVRHVAAWEIRRPRSPPRSDACASDCSHTRPRCAAGFFRPPRTPRDRWCRSRDPSARRCSRHLRAPAHAAPTTIACVDLSNGLPGLDIAKTLQYCSLSLYVRARHRLK